jgi:hypothetical protein
VFGDAWVSGDARVFGKLQLRAGLFFGFKYSYEKVQEIAVGDGNFLIGKGDIELGEDEPEVEEMTVEQICKALGKTVKIIK